MIKPFGSFYEGDLFERTSQFIPPGNVCSLFPGVIEQSWLSILNSISFENFSFEKIAPYSLSPEAKRLEMARCRLEDCGLLLRVKIPDSTMHEESLPESPRSLTDFAGQLDLDEPTFENRARIIDDLHRGSYVPPREKNLQSFVDRLIEQGRIPPSKLSR